jgi:methylenetetrahydrofolate dehydrogenase (NADP+) / methenyltetrahydrofolate cyclohydrolase
MAAQIIDGKAFAARHARKGGRGGRGLARARAGAGLAVVLVGEDPASQVYVRNKGKQTAEGRHALLRAQAGADTPEASCWR